MGKQYTPKEFLMMHDIKGEIIFTDAETGCMFAKADYEAGTSNMGLNLIEESRWFNHGKVDSLTAYHNADTDTEHFVLSLYAD